MHGIKLLNLTYQYDKQPMFKNINLQILPNSITCLAGSNGSGKSTLLKIMAGLMSNNGIILDNIPIKNYSRKSLAKKIAYLPQQSRIPPCLTVQEYVALGRFCHQSWFSRLNEVDRTCIEEAITLTNLTPLAAQAVTILSAGQQQRARIALMLAQQSHYLLLDEPMTGLDLKQQHNMLELLINLQKNHGKTIIVILHDLHQIMEIANHVILLKNFKIVGQGHPDDVINNDFLFNTFDFECNVTRYQNVFSIAPKKMICADK